jgi:hypothetical protein
MGTTRKSENHGTVKHGQGVITTWSLVCTWAGSMIQLVCSCWITKTQRYAATAVSASISADACM